ncbi:MAG: hypothetical protein KIT73_15715 [Burkholderiales bacterium]|nr:hypothetical protein [Burkholderiales bacterium]
MARANARGIDASAVSWSAVLAGATAIAALSLILLMLGVGLGLSSVSPWARHGISATAFGLSTILWLGFTQLAASGMGGYLAGRLRTRWTGVHHDETFFRDTAHGFLAWAIASLVTAVFLGSAIGSILGSGVQAGAAAIGGAATTVPTVAAAAAGAMATNGNGNGDGSTADPTAYFVDSLFRGESSTASASTGVRPDGASDDRAASPPIAEVTRIFAANVGKSTLPPQDVEHIGHLIARHTGMSEQEATERVNDTYVALYSTVRKAQAAATVAADKARKAAAYSALWLFVTLLSGAFIASLGATFGGRQRDA